MDYESKNIFYVTFGIFLPYIPAFPHRPGKALLVRLFLTARRVHGGDCEGVGQAKTSILVQAYSFTSAPIVKALLDDPRGGVRGVIPHKMKYRD
jgi:hypothetical protein